MKVYKCNKCRSQDIFINEVGNHIGLYCSDCGAWIKWLNKNERALVERQIKRNEYNEYFKIFQK